MSWPGAYWEPCISIAVVAVSVLVLGKLASDVRRYFDEGE